MRTTAVVIALVEMTSLSAALPSSVRAELRQE
jgi:hypothetical protein